MTRTPATTPAKQDPMLHGITASQRLIAALALHSLKLPSVRGSQPVQDGGFVELSGCTVELADALVFQPAGEVPRPAPPQPLPSCCTVTRTKRISIGGTVVITAVHRCAVVRQGRDQ